MAALDQFLKVVLTGDTRNLSSSLRNVQGELKNFGSTATRTFGSVQSAFATLGVTLSAGALAVGFKRIIDSMDALNDASKRLGVTTESLSALGYAAEQSGSSLEEVQTGLKFLNRSLNEAREGNLDLATTLRKIGITALDDTESAINKVADAFAKMPDGARKTALAMQLFGRSGANLIPLLNEGADGLAKFAAEARNMGLIVSGPAAKAADDFNDSMNSLGKTLPAIGIAIANDALPLITRLAGAMAGAARSGQGLGAVMDALGSQTGKELFDKFNGLGATQESIVTKTNRLAQLREKLAQTKARDRGGVLGDLDAKYINTIQKQIGELESELGRLWDRYKRLSEVEKLAADGAKLAADGAKQAAGAYEESAESIMKAAAAYKKLSESITEGKDSAKAGSGKSVEESSVLDINQLRDQAKTLLESGTEGDTKTALAMLQKAQKINDNLLATGQITKQYYLTQADLLLKLAEAGELAAEAGAGIRIGVDQEASLAAARAYADISKQFWAQNPAFQAVIPVTQQGITSGNVTGETADGRLLISAAGITGKAAGGLMRGPGTGLSDSIPVWLSAGEFVVKAAAVKNYGLGFLERLNSMALPRFAAGGAVGTPVTINLPGGQSFGLSAQPSVAKELSRVLGLEVLKRGRR